MCVGNEIHELQDSGRILSYVVTTNLKYIIYSVSTINKIGVNFVGLRLLNQINGNIVSINEHYLKPKKDLEYFLNTISVIDVPILSKNKTVVKVEKSKWIIINADDKLEAIEFSSLFDQNFKAVIWHLPNPRDCITSFACKADCNGSINILCSTKLGSVYFLKFSVLFGKWYKVQATYELGSDSLTCVSLGDRKYNVEFEDSVGFINKAVVSGYDNKITLLSKAEAGGYNLESEVIYPDFNEHNVLTSVDFQVFRERTPTSFISHHCGNVTNLGCILFERTSRGEWDLLEYLAKDSKKLESISSVNCKMTSTKGNTNIILIFSGSESGLLYEWDYDVNQKTLLRKKAHRVSSTDDVIHKIEIIDDRVYYLINSNRIGYVALD